MKISNMDLGTVCAYAIHDCMGRESFVPDIIRSIVTPLLPELPDKTLRMMREHCLWQKRSEAWGCQKGEWIKWAKAVKDECERRGI